MQKFSYVFLLFLLCLSNSLKGQNLVPNNSFENVDKCREFEIPYHLYLKDWWSPNSGTPDVFLAHCKPKYNMPKNYGGKSMPAHGEVYAGLVVYSPEEVLLKKGEKDKNYAEYLETKLQQRLVKDSVYRISFFYQLGSNSRYAASGLGIHVSKQKLKTKHHFFPIDAHYSLQEVNHPVGRWRYFVYDYTATGKEQFLTIGRFGGMEDKKLVNISPDSQWYEKNNYAYYFIDYVDFRLKQREDSVQFYCLEEMNKRLRMLDTLTVDSTAKFVMDMDLFDPETQELFLEDSNELKKLVDFLQKDTLYLLEISTHVFENEGTQNKATVSKLRNEALVNYLTQLGMPEKRMRTQIFTTQHPITQHQNEWYKTLNKRLQFRFIYLGDTQNYQTKYNRPF